MMMICLCEADVKDGCSLAIDQSQMSLRLMPFGVHQNQNGCTHEVNRQGIFLKVKVRLLLYRIQIICCKVLNETFVIKK